MLPTSILYDVTPTGDIIITCTYIQNIRETVAGHVTCYHNSYAHTDRQDSKHSTQNLLSKIAAEQLQLLVPAVGLVLPASPDGPRYAYSSVDTTTFMSASMVRAHCSRSPRSFNAL